MPASRRHADGAPPTEQGWTRFRGPNGTGIGTTKGIQTPTAETDFAWKVPLPGSGHSSPVLWQGKIFVTSAEDGQGKRHLHCLNAPDGRILWTRIFNFRSYHLHDYNTSASATPAVDKDRVYILWSENEAFIAVAMAHDGREVWRRDLGSFPTQHGGAVSPIVHDGLLLFAMEPENARGGLYALDCRTGQTAWKVERDSQAASYSVPLLYRPRAGPLEAIFTSMAHGITSVNPKTGKLNWELKDIFRMRCVFSPVQVGFAIFAGSGEGAGARHAVAIAPEMVGPKPTVVYEVTRNAPYVPTPLVLNGNLYLWGDGGILTCINGDTGRELWKERVGGNYFGSPVFTDNRLWAMNTRGELVVAEIKFGRPGLSVGSEGDTLKQITRVDLGEPSHATPAIANGQIYLRTLRHLIALGPTTREKP